jgi:class 3 adenylate cyclase
MPLYVDIHELPGITPEELAKAHFADLEKQGKYGVEYLKYWANHDCGKVYCLVDAPNPEAACRVHAEAHGFVAGKIIEVAPELLEGFLGGVSIDSTGAAILPGGTTQERDAGVRTVLFTDIVGSTSFTQRVGDEAAMHSIHLHDRVVRDALAALGGREVKHTGDGIMASFVSAAAAMKCAARIQADLQREAAGENGETVNVRIGAAAGEPVEHHHDLFGATVQLAARLCASAAPRQILVSNTVAELCMGKGVEFQDLGELALKGFDRAVRAHAVLWAPALPAKAAAVSV